MNQPSSPTPPKWATKFLNWFVAEDLIEEIEGDLLESYRYRYQTLGPKSAKRKYALEVSEISVLRSRNKSLKSFDAP